MPYVDDNAWIRIKVYYNVSIVLQIYISNTTAQFYDESSIWLEHVLVFFFFQAEDGIRYLTVTGVQTCALPISGPTQTLRRPRAPTGRPSCNASWCHSFVIEHPPQARVGARQLRFGKTHRLAHLLRDLLVGVALDIVQPYHRTRCLAQPLERPLEIDLGGHCARAHSAHAAPRPHPHDRLLVQLFRLPHPVMPNPHQRLGGGDLPDPAPQVSFPAVLIDAPHHLEKRLLQHILGVLGTPQHA